MEEKKKEMVDSCNFRDVGPIMMELPYPTIKVNCQNQTYANILSIDYCGAVSELSAITQYINSHGRMSLERCELAKTILGIAIAEMIHLQKLGQLIQLLGGCLDFKARYREEEKIWTPEYLKLPDDTRKILTVSIEGERAAINQYRRHIRMIKDNNINAVLARIIKDEEYHILMLQALMKD